MLKVAKAKERFERTVRLHKQLSIIRVDIVFSVD
jgi:hypothetical protein